MLNYINFLPDETEYSINAKDIKLIIYKRKYYYKVIYPDNTSEIYFLASSLKKRIRKYIKNDDEFFLWTKL